MQTRNEQVTVSKDLLGTLFDMATSHVEDIESGLEDGSYEAKENADAETKRASLDAAQAILNQSAGASEQTPFMTTVAGHVMFHDGATGKTLDDNWCGICTSGDSTSAFWLIGRDNGERSYMKLPVSICTIENAREYVKALTQPAALTPTRSPEAQAIYAALENSQAVICDVLPAGINTDWIILNAPRPLVGDQYFENGEFAHGRFYAAIDPNGSMAAKWLKIDLELDARVVFVASKELQQAMVFELIPDEYKPAYLNMCGDDQQNALRSYLSHLRKARKLKELAELARKAGERQKTCALSATGNSTH